MLFFKEGGRFIIDNVYYVKEGEIFVLVGMIEFVKDKFFGYKLFDIGEWCEEKINGKYKFSDMIYILLKEFRELNIEVIIEKFKKVEGFNKIIVNVIDYVDVKVFIIVFIWVVNSGKEFMFRSVVVIIKVFGGVSDKELFIKDELVLKGNINGGIIFVGLYVNKII